MLDYGFANWEVVTPKPSEERVEPVKVLFGAEGVVDVVYGSAQPVVIKKGDKEKIVYKTEMCSDIMAPVEKGQRLGTVNMFVGENKIGEYGIFSAAEVKRLDFGCAFVMILKEFLSLK